MNAPRKSKTISDQELDRALDADFEHSYFDEEHMEFVPTVCEGLGTDFE